MSVTPHPMSPPWELIGAGVAGVLAGFGELYRRGKLRFRRENNGMNNSDRNTMSEIAETTERIEKKTDRNAYLIQQFHGNEDISVQVDEVLDDDEDFYRSGNGS